MDNVLGKYTDLNNSSPKIEDGFQLWKKKNVSVAPENAEELYFRNIVNLYQTQKEPNLTLKNDFQSFVGNITFLFKGSEYYDRLKSLNFDDKSQIRVMLPVIVSKIKEIIAYYKNKRKSLRNAKPELFLNGTKNSIEISLYNLLNDLSLKNPDDSNDLSTYGLSSLKVEFVQLYDLFDYYNSTNVEYVRNIEILSKNPIFFNIVNYLEEFPNAEYSDYGKTCDDNVYDIENQIDFSQKYSSCFLTYLSGFEKTEQIYPYTLDIKKGENFFHWISGENLFEKSDIQIIKTSIHDLNWNNATSSNDIKTSDIMFVDGPEGKKASWFKKYDNELVKDEIVVNVTKNLEFRYPFPGKGLSGEGFEWTGASIKKEDVDLQLFYGKDFNTITKEVDTKYWETTSLGISSAQSILLNDTTLIDSGAYASDDYEKADRLEIRLKSNDGIFDGIYNDVEKHLWLYDFKETEIPIIPGNNNIYWPLGRYDNVSELFFEYKAGDSVVLSSIDVSEQFVGALASTTITNADKIFRLKTYCGPDIECAWLKGIPLSSINPNSRDGCNCEENTRIVPTRRIYKNGTVQNYFYFKASPNEFTPFNLGGMGEDVTINLNDIPSLRGQIHDNTCQYNHQLLNDLYNISKFNKNDLVVNQWKNCNCKAIKFSPFGHRGNTYTDYDSYADFIVLHINPAKPFNFKTWKGSDGKDYKTSKDFAWFKLEESSDKNIGWGRGRWITSDGTEMVLNSLDQYLYYRTSIDRCEGYQAPFGVFKHAFCKCVNVDENCNMENCVPVWMKAEKDETGNWVDVGEISDMMLESNNFYRYEHQEKSDYSTQRLTVSGQYLDNVSEFEMSSATDTFAYFEEFSNSYQGMNFVWNCPINNAKAYWTESDLNLSSTMIIS
jgi:hypothetical protein